MQIKHQKEIYNIFYKIKHTLLKVVELTLNYHILYAQSHPTFETIKRLSIKNIQFCYNNDYINKV